MSILVYHGIGSLSRAGITGVAPKKFEGQVLAAVNQGISFHTLTEYIKGGGEEARRVALTFDDGFASLYDYAFPVLRSLGIRGTVFVIPGYSGQMNTWDVNLGSKRAVHLSWSQVDELVGAGWEVGSHSLQHRDLTRLPESEAEKELLYSRMLIEKRLGTFNGFISYPFGNVNPLVSQLCQRCGYSGGVVMGRVRGDVPHRFSVPRIGIYAFDTLRSFLQKSIAINAGFYHIIQRTIDFCSDGTVHVKKRFWIA